MPRTIPRSCLLPLLTALALVHAPLIDAEDATPSAPPNLPPVAQTPVEAPAEPDPAQIEAWLAAGRALKAERPELFGGAEGVLATLVLPDGQGAAAGIAPGDVLIGYGDTPLDSAKQLIGLTGKIPPETMLTLRWLRPDAEGEARLLVGAIRGGRIGVGIRDIAAVPAARPPSFSQTVAQPELKQIGSWLAAALALKADQPALFDDSEGVLVTKVLPAGQAAEAGVAPGDILIGYDDQVLVSAQHLNRVIADQAASRTILLRWLRPSLRDTNPAREARVQSGDLGVVGESVRSESLPELKEQKRALEEAAYAAPDRKAAIEIYQQGAVWAAAIGMRAWQGEFLNRVGVLLDDDEQSTLALEYFTQALRIARETGDLGAERSALIGLGLAHKRLGQYPDAMNAFSQSLAISQRTGNRRGEAVDLANVGIVYEDIGRYQDALDHHTRALAIDQELGDQSGQAQDLVNLGNVLQAMGKYDQAIEHFDQALVLFRKVGARGCEAASVGNLGILYAILGEHAAAEEKFREAERISQAIGDSRGQTKAAANLAKLHSRRGEYALAIQTYMQVLDALTKRQDRAGMALHFGNLAEVYERVGARAEAIEYSEKALAIHREIGDRPGEANDLRRLGITHRGVGEHDAALTHLQQARTLAQEVGDPGALADVIASLASVYVDFDRYDEAEAQYRLALSIYRELGTPSGETAVLLGLGVLEHLRGNLAAARDAYQQALARQAGLAEPEIVWRLWNNLSEISAAESQPGPAIAAGKRAVNTIQAMRATNQSLAREHQLSFMEDKQDAYRHLADLLITQGRIPEAEQVLAMLKEEELYDFIRRGATQDDPRTTRADWTPAEAAWNARYDAVADDLAALGLEYRQLAKLTLPDDAEQQRLAELEQRLDAGGEALIAIVRALEEEFAAQGGAAAVAFGAQQLDWLRGQQAMLARLGHGAVLISTIVTEDRLHLILTTPDTQTAAKTEITRAELNRLVLDFRAALTDPHADPRTKLLPLAQRLHAVLVAPIADALAQAQAGTLMWSLDAALRYVPLAALHDGERWLIEHHPLALYTLAARDNMREENPDLAWRVAGLGVSRAHQTDDGYFSALDAVPAELDGIVRRTPDDPNGVIEGELHLDDAFDEPRLKAMLRARYPVLHIASHFKLNPGDNSASFLLLGDGSRLALADFEAKTAYRLDHIDQLTLSACDTAMGNPERSGSGAEVESFGALAQKRGAKGVLATLWPVADASTGALMQALYRARGADPTLTKAEALRQAQLSLVHGSRGQGIGETAAKDDAEVGPDADSDTVTAADTPAANCTPERRPLVVSASAESAPDATVTDRTQQGAPACRWSHPYYWAPFVLMGNWL